MGVNKSKLAEATHNSAEREINYSLKKQPIIAVGKSGRAITELSHSKGVALYEPDQLIYIADYGNCCIQVVTFDGDFVTSFGQGILYQPWGIAVSENYVFVTDYDLHALFRFSDFKLAMTVTRGSGEGQLDYPSGLCIDYNGDVYVADCDNNRVCIYSEDLAFLNCFGQKQLKFPRNVKITLNSIIVLDSGPNCVHFYSRCGHLMNSLVSCRNYGMSCRPLFFCLDVTGNILLSDNCHHDIKIVSPSGQLIHSIGREGNGRGEFVAPCGIDISEFGNMFVLSLNRNFCLQSFSLVFD